MKQAHWRLVVRRDKADARVAIARKLLTHFYWIFVAPEMYNLR
jgi:hypothetical protein